MEALEASVEPLPGLRSAPVRDAGSQGLFPLLVQRVDVLRRQPAGADVGVGDVGADVGAAWPGERRASLVQQFLRERATLAQGTPDVAMPAERLVDLSIDVLGWPPDRTGPLCAVRLLAEVVPGSLIAPESVLVDLDRVAPQWLAWVLERMGLPEGDRKRALVIVRQAAEVMSGQVRDTSLRPERAYVAYLPREAARGETLFAVLARRIFAVPLPGKRGDGFVELPRLAHGVRAGRSHVDELDAARATHRELVTAIGQACLGTDRQDFPAHVGIVEQLWDDPSEVRQAAQRLTRSGLARENVLEQLARVWRTCGPQISGELQTGRVDGEGQLKPYREALSRLGRSGRAPR